MTRPRLFRKHTGTHVPAKVAAREWPTQLEIAFARKVIKRYAAFTASGGQWPPSISKEQLALISDHQHDAAVVLSAALERAERTRCQ